MAALTCSFDLFHAQTGSDSIYPKTELSQLFPQIDHRIERLEEELQLAALYSTRKVLDPSLELLGKRMLNPRAY